MRDSGSIGLSLIVWTICGLVAFLGALCYIELGTEIQRSGSEYSYLLNGFGKLPAFIYSWGSALVIRPTVTATVSLVMAEYFCKAFSNVEDELTKRYIALSCIGKKFLFNVRRDLETSFPNQLKTLLTGTAE